MIRDKLLLDVGGTFIKCSDGRSIPVNSDGSREEIALAFRKAVWDAEELASNGVRVAIPGPFGYSDGRFLMKHKYAAVFGEYFADLAGISREKCRFVHDVVAMLLGELHPDSPNTLLLTMGTGLGSAVYKDGTILVNELGSTAVSIWGTPFRDGVLEDYVSKRGIVGRYGDPSLSVKEIAARAFAGDEKACAVFEETGEILGGQIMPVLETYAISSVLLGGQISRSWKLFAPALVARLPGGISLQPVSDFDNATFNGLKTLV